MQRQAGRLTAQEQQFIRLVVEEGHSYVAAYRLSYPPRNGTRSPVAERVAAKRVAHRPLVQERMEELRANDPGEMRRRANAVLGQILDRKLDPRYRRTALDVLKRLDEHERAAARADREALRTITAQMAALDALENGARRNTRSIAAKPPAKERPPVSLEEIIDEIDQLVREQPAVRDLEPMVLPLLEAPPVPPQARDETVPGEANGAVAQETAAPQSAGQLVRKPGTFGRASWVRQPHPR